MDTRVKSTKTLNTLSRTRLNLVKFEIFAGPSLKISGGYYEISGGLSFTCAIAQTALLRVVTPPPPPLTCLENGKVFSGNIEKHNSALVVQGP